MTYFTCRIEEMHRRPIKVDDKDYIAELLCTQDYERMPNELIHDIHFKQADVFF